MTAQRTRRRRDPSKRNAVADTGTPHAQRLQKVLAAAGVASRRECEQLMLEGRVEVDRQVVTQLGTKVDPETQEIRVDGSALSHARLAYYAVNKPKGIVSTNRDPAGRALVVDLVPETQGRVFTVGRLDKDSEGLILVTNDGELANRLTHPRYGIEKVYQVQVAGIPNKEVLQALKRGVRLDEGVVRAKSVRMKRRHKQSTVLEIVLAEGRNREIRRMLARLGHKVQRLRRVAIGPLSLGNSELGEARPLSHKEIRDLRAATGLAAGTKRRSDADEQSASRSVLR